MKDDVGRNLLLARDRRAELAQLLEDGLVERRFRLGRSIDVRTPRLLLSRGDFFRLGRAAPDAALAGPAAARGFQVAEVAEQVLPPAPARVGEADHPVEHLPLARHPQLEQLEIHQQIRRLD